MSNELISVIVPIYNVEKYLPRMISMLAKQTYPNLEIILVDDGSKDHSYCLCCDYEKQYENVHAFHKTNEGAACTRNFGFEHSHGEYIAFVDADDWITEDYIQFLYDLLKKNDADISICGYKKFFDKIEVSKKQEISEIEILSPEVALEDLLYRRRLTNSPCLKLMKREIFRRIMFPKGKLYEDLAVVYRWFGESKKIVYSPDIKYYYYQRHGSSMHSEFNIKKWDRILISKEICEYVNKKYPKLYKAAEVRLFISGLQMLRELPLNDEYKAYQLELVQILKQTRSIVLFDSQVNIKTKILAVAAYIPPLLLKKLGILSDKFIMKFKIVQRY